MKFLKHARRIGLGPSPGVRIVYDGAHVAFRFVDADGDGGGDSSLANRYLHGPVIDQILADEQVHWDAIGEDYVTDDLYWPLADHLGTVRDLASFDSGSGDTTVVNHLTIDYFGQATAETNSAVDHLFAYTGRERDDDAGLHYYRARWYDADTGQFVSQDPIGFRANDDNLYRYVANRTTSRSDPSGLADVQDYLSPNVAVAALHGFFIQGPISVLTMFRDMGIEMVNQANDLDSASHELIYHHVFGQRWRSEDRSQLSAAMSNPNFSYRDYYRDLAANAATLGTYGQRRTLDDWYHGRITTDQASGRLGATGVLQLIGARAMSGPIATRPIPGTPSLPAVVGRIGGMSTQSGTLPWPTLPPVFASGSSQFIVGAHPAGIPTNVQYAIPPGANSPPITVSPGLPLPYNPALTPAIRPNPIVLPSPSSSSPPGYRPYIPGISGPSLTPLLRPRPGLPAPQPAQGCPPDAPRPHGINLEALTPTQRVASHIPERPYINSPHTIRNIIESGTPRPDPGGFPGALRWDVPGSFQGSAGTFQLVIDPATNRILHFLFRSGG